ncbi:MAG: hypothetical protein ACRDQA_17650 [Nocardioidaceae bacterium]
MMTMSGPRRAPAVAREYEALQGLAAVGLGAGGVVAAFTEPPVAGVALGVVLGASAPAWYHRRYGLAKPKATRTWWSLFGAALATLGVFAAYALDIAVQRPVLATPLVLAAALAVGQYLSLRRTGLTWLHWAVYVLVAASAAGPLLGLGIGTNLLTYVLVVGGLAFIVLGVVDHIRLVRFMGPVDERSVGER